MKIVQHNTTLNILLTDDDTDDCLFFESALKEIPIGTHLTTLKDGEQLMNYLSENPEKLPSIIFLDLAMPRKTGFVCLDELNLHEKLKDIPVFVFTISLPNNQDFEMEIKTILTKMGAQGYIRKSSDSTQLKESIHSAIISVMEKSPLEKKM